MRSLLKISIFLLFLASTSICQSSKIGVALDVTADASIKSEIESYVRRQLRLLNDVDLYATTPDFEIQLVAIKPGSAVAISVVVLEKTDFTAYLNNELKKSNVSGTTRDDLIKTLAARESLKEHFLFSDSISKLDELCSSIVAKIDASSFESERKFKRLVEKYLVAPPASGPKTTAKPITSEDSPFQREYVGGETTTILIKNETDRVLTLIFGGVKYSLASGSQREIEVGGGRYEYSASVPRAYPKSGVKEFGKGYRFSWRFFIVRR